MNLKPELREAIKRCAREIGGKKIEYAYVLNLDGEEIWHGKGTARSVGIEREAQLGMVVIHNHPTEGCFSTQDFGCAIYYNWALAVVVTPSQVHILARPRNWWPHEMAAIAKTRSYARMAHFLTVMQRQGLYECTSHIKSEARFVCGAAGVQEAW
jgi:hypothetical protein